MKTQRYCAYCGAGFVIQDNHQANKQYCCLNCRRKAQAERTKQRPDSRLKLSFITQQVLRNYGRKCAICGWFADVDETRYPSRGNEVHHIKPVSKGGENKYTNMILLCPNCHRLAHLGVIKSMTLRHRRQYGILSRQEFVRIYESGN